MNELRMIDVSFNKWKFEGWDVYRRISIVWYAL